jgi:hypothetical protein
MVVVPVKFAQKGLELRADMLFNPLLLQKKSEKEKGYSVGRDLKKSCQAG